MMYGERRVRIRVELVEENEEERVEGREKRREESE